MYLYINKDIIINKKEIIGIFNLEKNNKEVYNNIVDKKNIIDISKENQKSFILYKNKNNIKGIISNISSKSIEKRIK